MYTVECNYQMNIQIINVITTIRPGEVASKSLVGCKGSVSCTPLCGLTVAINSILTGPFNF